MIDIRAAWFEECGGPPPGNKRTHSSCIYLVPLSVSTAVETAEITVAAPYKNAAACLMQLTVGCIAAGQHLFTTQYL